MFNAKRISAMTVGVGFLSLLLSVSAYSMGINKSIVIDADQTVDGQSTVNGSITVGKNARINGSLETVNGSIRVANGVHAGDIETVNGSIRLGSEVNAQGVETVNGSITVDTDSVISRSVETVNGRISLQNGVTVAENMETVNGELDMIGATVQGNASTVNGSVTLSDQAVLKGDLTIEKAKSSFWHKSDSERKMPVVTIGPGSRVGGTLVLKRKVKLFISDSAEVGGVSGVMTMEDAVRFSGEHP